MKDSVEATLRSLRAKLELEAAFGSEGALRFLIRIAPDHFTIKIRLDQADAFRTAARRRLPGAFHCAAASIRPAHPRVSWARMACSDQLRAWTGPMDIWSAVFRRPNFAEHCRIC